MLKKSKLVALLLATTVFATACGQTQPSNSSESAQASSETAGAQQSEVPEEVSYFNETGYPIVNEEITLKVLTQMTPNEHVWTDMEDAPGWKYVSELTGIKFEFEVYTKDELATKLPLIMSDPNSMPDIFWQVGMSEADMQNYADMGLIMQLDDLVDQYGENIKKCWDSNAAFKGYAASTDGNVYMLPAYNDTGISELRNFMVNTKWMENCGIESMPTNLDEFKEMLIKFRDMDANGNGDPTDEIPLDGDYTDFLKYLEESTGMISSWPRVGVMYSTDYEKTEAYPKFADERYRFVVEYLADLYDEGLLTQDFLTVTGEERGARKEADKVGVLNYNTAFTGKEKYNPDDWSIMPYMTSDYMSEYKYTIVAPSYQTCMAMISANTEYPEACIRLLDYFFTLEGSFLSYPSANIDQYDFTGADISPEVLAIAEKAFELGDGNFNMAIAEMLGTYGCLWRNQMAEYQLEKTDFKSNLEKSVFEMRDEHSDKPDWVGYFNNLKFTTEEQETIGLYKTDLDSYVKEQVARWITGEQELTDASWEAYIAQCKKLHMDDLTEIYQNGVNRWYGVE